MIKHSGLSLFNSTIRNAKELVENAILLQSRESYGHAYALGVLAFEEFGKAIAGYYWYLGIFEEDELSELNIFSDHVNKQILALNILSTFVMLEYYETVDSGSQIYNWIDSFLKGELDSKKLEKRIMQSAITKNTNESKNLIEIQKSITKFEQKSTWLDQKKQSGFYVDMKNRKITSPQDLYEFSLENTEPFLQTVAFLVNYFFELNVEMRKLKRESKETLNFKKFIQMVRKEWNINFI